jgi:hypothetical protein
MILLRPGFASIAAAVYATAVRTYVQRFAVSGDGYG